MDGYCTAVLHTEREFILKVFVRFNFRVPSYVISVGVCEGS